MQIVVISEYEVTYQTAEPVLVIHHLIRGYDLVSLDKAAVNQLRELIATVQKRIRTIGEYQFILGAGGDMTIYAPGGVRACYFNDSQTAKLAQLLKADLTSSS